MVVIGTFGLQGSLLEETAKDPEHCPIGDHIPPKANVRLQIRDFLPNTIRLPNCVVRYSSVPLRTVRARSLEEMGDD